MWRCDAIEGTHALTETLELTPADSYITFAPYPGEAAAMSGAKKLNTEWKPYVSVFEMSTRNNARMRTCTRKRVTTRARAHMHTQMVLKELL